MNRAISNLLAVLMSIISTVYAVNHSRQIPGSAGDLATDLNSRLEEADWLDSQESGGTVYFLFEFPSRIERYDLGSQSWLPEISLDFLPFAFAVDPDGIYVSFSNGLYRFDLDGTGMALLNNGGSMADTLFMHDDYLFLHIEDVLISYDKNSGVVIDSGNFFYSMLGIDFDPVHMKAFARSDGVSPADILYVEINPDGTLGNQEDSPYHGDYEYADRAYVFPNASFVADNSGIVYSTTDLTYAGSLAGNLDNLAFFGNQPIVQRDGVFYLHSENFLEQEFYTPIYSPVDIFSFGTTLYSFFDEGFSIGVEIIPFSAFNPPVPGPAIDPHGYSFIPDQTLLGNGEIIYLLSKADNSVFRWSTAARDYLDTIPLIGSPYYAAYSPVTNRLYLAYENGKVTEIVLDNSISEEVLFNTPIGPCGLATAGEFIFVCDPAGAWESHFIFSPEGALIDQEEWNYYSATFTWSEANQRMYHFRDGQSPNDLYWEVVDGNGNLGEQQDSPYHTSEGIEHPIRVAPNGSIVVLGSGYIFNAISLTYLKPLPNAIADAAWLDGALFTLRGFNGQSQVQSWGNNNELLETAAVLGTPLSMHTIDEGLLVITNLAGHPYYLILDADLEILYVQPAVYLPVIIR